MENEGEDKLLLSSEKSTDDEPRRDTPSIKERLWSYMVLVSSVLSLAMGTGSEMYAKRNCKYSQSRHFNITLEQASWTISVHTVFYLVMSK